MFVIRDRWISEFEASLIYRVSSRTARATQRNSVSRNQKKKKKPKKKKSLLYSSGWSGTLHGASATSELPIILLPQL
jgi:hypothetical protein